MKLLLHACCAPCAIHPAREAKKDNFTVTGFLYNPNIHPRSEYTKRRKELESYFRSEGLKLICPEHNAAIFFRNISNTFSGPGRSEEGLTRCAACWNMRLEETVAFAKKEKYDAFTTTLLASPYQDHRILKEICENLSKEKNVSFYYRDFRIGFLDAHNLAGERGMYCQNYCGCVFSMVEREERRKTCIT